MYVIDGMFILCGIYMIYQSVVMRKEGYIPEGFMINKGTVLKKEADVAGFILDMTWKGIMTGVVACVSGTVAILSQENPAFENLAIIFYFISVLIIVIFIVFLKRAQKKYLKMDS